MKYDAVIVGASIAGLYAALKLSRSNLRICVVDRRKHIGTPVRCGEATGNRLELRRFFEIEEDWIAREVEGLAVHINDSFQMRRRISEAGVVLHRDRFEKHLAQQARNHGAEILLEKRVAGLVKGKRGWSGVKLEDGHVIEGAYIVGADGCESMVGQWAGITSPLRLADAFTSLQYTVKSDFCNDGCLHFFAGKEVIPNGYLWVFPKAAGKISVGAGYYGAHHNVPKIKEYLDRFCDKHIPGVAKKNLITGCAPLAVCPRQLSRKNVVVVGDAARQVNPLTAGGIMNTLEAVDMAGEALIQCHKESSFRPLKAYSRKWSKRPRFDQKMFLMLKKILVTSPNDVIEKALRTADGIFKDPILRDQPITLPLFKMARLFIQILPRVIRFQHVLWQ